MWTTGRSIHTPNFWCKFSNLGERMEHDRKWWNRKIENGKWKQVLNDTCESTAQLWSFNFTSHSQGWFHGCVICAVAHLVPGWAQNLVSYCVFAVLKVLILLNKRPHISIFTLGPANYSAGPAHNLSSRLQDKDNN